MTPVNPIGPLQPFACSYRKDGIWYAITLWATSEENILPGYRVDGKLISTKETKHD